MPTRYYAVAVGRQPGIYDNWPAAQAMVTGYSGAVFKSFPTREAAEAFLAPTPVLVATSGVTIYTDGSYQDGVAGFGVVILAADGQRTTAYGRVPLAAVSNNVAEVYAIYVALSLMRSDLTICTDSTYALNSLTIWFAEHQRRGWRGLANQHLLEATHALMAGRTVTFQHVRAHTGIEFNELADRLAEQGRQQRESLILSS